MGADQKFKLVAFVRCSVIHGPYGFYGVVKRLLSILQNPPRPEAVERAAELRAEMGVCDHRLCPRVPNQLCVGSCVPAGKWQRPQKRAIPI